MSKYIEDKVIKIIEDGTAISSEVSSDEITLNNYQSAKVVITSGEGDTATTKASVVAILSDGTTKTIKETEIAVGGNAESTINIVANEIAKYDAVSFKIVIGEIAESALTIGAVAVLGEARYSE